jgi:hypothetical protein
MKNWTIALIAIFDKTLAKAIESRPNFFKSIRALTANIDKQRAETVAAFRKFNTLYPEVIFPDAWFVIGQMQSGGTTSANGLLMGAELFTRAARSPAPK